MSDFAPPKSIDAPKSEFTLNKLKLKNKLFITFPPFLFQLLALYSESRHF